MLALAHLDPRRDASAQFGDVADEPDHPVALAQAVEDVHDLLQRLGVEAAEALVHEQRLDRATARLGGHDIGQPEGQGERGQEGLAAGQRRRIAIDTAPGIAHEQAEPAAPAAPASASEWTRV